MNNLTKIAALPGSGAGCMASLPAERMEAKKETFTLGPYMFVVGPQAIEFWGLQNPEDWSPKVQMKAPYFEEPKNIWSDIDWGNFDLSGGFGC